MQNTDWVIVEMAANEDEQIEMTWGHFVGAGYRVDNQLVEQILDPNGIFFGDEHGASHIHAVSRLLVSGFTLEEHKNSGCEQPRRDISKPMPFAYHAHSFGDL